MPIPDSEINHDWIEIPLSATVRQVRDAIPPDERRKRWVVTRLPDGQYAVFRLTDLGGYLQTRAHGDNVEQWMLNSALGEFQDFLASCSRKPVQRADNLEDVKETWNALGDPPLVVLENGTPIGVLKSVRRGGGGETDWLDHEPKSANGGGHPPQPALPMSPEEAAPDDGSASESETSAPSGTGASGPTTLPAEAAQTTAPARKINVRFDPEDQKDRPLQVGETYTLVFSVDLETLAASIADAPLDERRLFPANVDRVELYVQLLSDDFDIYSDPQKLIVPREGKSKNRARFDISPKHNGECALTAVFVKDGNAVQAMEIKLNVGVGDKAIADSRALGRPVEAVGAVQPRALSIWIDYVGAGFKFSFLGPNGAQSFIVPLQLPELEQAINDARTTLLEMVHYQDKGTLFYQQGLDIPPAVNQKFLPKLAEAGYLLFRTIFLHPGAGQPAKDFAKRLREMAKGDTLNIQIISKEMLLPWGMLYIAEKFDPNNINPEWFLGLEHIIEHAPMQPDMDFSYTIPSQPQLTVSLNFNREIDAAMGFPLIGNQDKFWKALAQKGNVKLVERSKAQELVDALANDKTPDQIAYFYCHAVSKGLSEGGARGSTLQFGKNQSVTLRDLDKFAPSDQARLPAAPLVFINACESAELSPQFYNGFMPYFVDKGARGMIGTECEVPALFAMDWATKFFDRFLKGAPLGQIFLDLRREYYYNHNNLLGLLYAVYCDADTKIEPALA